jgi:N-acetylmuramoyl-L-alanine amidase
MNLKARLTSLIPVLACLATASSLCAEIASGPVALTSVRVWSVGPVTRVAIQLTGEVEYRRDQITEPPRLFLDLHGCVIKLDEGYSRVMRVDDPLVDRIRIALNKPTVARIVFDLKQPVDYEISQLANPMRLVIELRARGASPRPSPGDTGAVISEDLEQAQPAGGSAVAASAAANPERTAPASLPEREPAQPVRSSPQPPIPVATAKSEQPAAHVEVARAEPKPNEPWSPPIRSSPFRVPPASPGLSPAESATPVQLRSAPKPADPGSGKRTSLTRALGLKLTRIAIDPGHGGHDHGTTGPGGVVEKDLALDVAKRLGVLIEKQLGAEVVYTRDSDVFIPLEERTALANRMRADLFLSIHVNSSRVRSASGPEVFYLNFTDSKDDLEVAARENAGHGKSIFELSELLQKIALKDKIAESSEFARRVQRSLYKLNSPQAKSRNRGVKKAPFVVLIGASMPSILAEVGFVTNSKEEALMKRSDHRDRIAEAICQGLADYAATLSKMTVAQESATRTGQGAKR